MPGVNDCGRLAWEKDTKWGIGVALLFVVRARGLSLPRWALRGLGFWHARSRRKNEAPRSDPFDAAQPDGTRIGFHWDGTTLMSLVRIEEIARSTRS